MRVVLDTNVIISAYVFGGRPLDVLRLAEQGKIELLTSHKALTELLDVLRRDRFFDRLSDMGMEPEEVVANYADLAVPVGLSDEPAISSDADDNAFIGIAVGGEAACIVSGDRHLLSCSAASPVPVLRVSEFLALVHD